MRAVHVGNSGNRRLYYLIDLEEGKDGALLAPDNSPTLIDFWSFVSKIDTLTTIEDSKFHRFLWHGHKSREAQDWSATFVEKVISPSKEMLSTAPVITKFPEPREEKQLLLAEKASDFRSYARAGFAEKAIGRALGRGGRLATGGIRGFVRGAIFDPNAVDADEDGWVQEGTQFARRSTRRVRSAVNGSPVNRYNTGGFASSSGMNPTPIKDRRVPNKFDISKGTGLDVDVVEVASTVASINKKVEDAFNDGQPMTTRGQFLKAFSQSIPSFGDGSSKADFLDGDEGEELNEFQKNIAYVFLSNVLNNPDWDSVTWNIQSRLNRLRAGDRTQWSMEEIDPRDPDRFSKVTEGSSGAWAMYRPGSLISRLRGTSIYRNVGGRKGRIEISYREDDTPYSPKFKTNLETYTTRIFNGLMNELNSRRGMTDDERSAIYQNAVQMAHRSMIEHEFGHAAHYIASQKSARKRISDILKQSGKDDDVVASALGRSIVAAMPPEHRRAYVRAVALSAGQNLFESMGFRGLTEYMENLARHHQATGDPMSLQQLQMISQMSQTQSLFEMLRVFPVRALDGSRVKLSKNQAKYIDQLTDVIGAGGPPVVEGSDLTLGHAWLLLGGNISGPDGMITGLLPEAFQEHRRKRWAGRDLMSRFEVPNPNYDPTQPPSISNSPAVGAAANSPALWSHFYELGLPPIRVPGGAKIDGLQPEETRVLLDALTTHVARAHSALNVRSSIMQAFGDPPRGIEPSFPNELSGLADNRAITSALLDHATADDNEILGAASTVFDEFIKSVSKAEKYGQPGTEKDAGGFAESLIMALGHWDELSHDEIEIAREIADFSGRGAYANYMGTWTGKDHMWDLANFASSAEFFAELSALAAFGQRLSLSDRDGKDVDLTASQRAVLRKILAWLKPGSVVSMG